MRCYRCLIGVLFFIYLHTSTIAQSGDSTRFEIHSININSKQSDFSPFLFNKKLYFASGRANRVGVTYLNAETTQDITDMFYAERKDSINFKKPSSFSEINTRNDDGPICFNKEGTELYITSNDVKRTNANNKTPLSIFISKKVNDKWSKPEVLPFCTENFSYCHPALLKDGKTLIFSSDVKGGYGGMDLYYSTFKNGTWTIPRNLGRKINSTVNEIFPFVSVNNMLYFSANRKKGFGGLDIYSFNLKDSVLQLLSLPINSTYDDFGVWIDSTERCGYLSSNRDTVKSDDIYYFRNKYPDFDKCTPNITPKYCYTFFEEASLSTKDTLGMVYEWDFGDGSKKRGLSAKHCFSKPGTYVVQLNILDKKSGTLFTNQVSYDFVVDPSSKFYIDCADTQIANQAFALDIWNVVIPDHTIREAHWFFGDDKFSTGISAQHVYKKTGTYTIKLGLVTKNNITGVLENMCTQKTIRVIKK